MGQEALLYSVGEHARPSDQGGRRHGHGHRAAVHEQVDDDDRDPLKEIGPDG
jgi:hypothetical protein